MGRLDNVPVRLLLDRRRFYAVVVSPKYVPVRFSATPYVPSPAPAADIARYRASLGAAWQPGWENYVQLGLSKVGAAYRAGTASDLTEYKKIYGAEWLSGYDAAAETLKAVASDPSEEDVRIAAIVDRLFLQDVLNENPDIPWKEISEGRMIFSHVPTGLRPQETVQAAVEFLASHPGANNPFLWPPSIPIPEYRAAIGGGWFFPEEPMAGILVSYYSGGRRYGLGDLWGVGDRSARWGVGPSKTWADLRVPASNAFNATSLLREYPWPRPAEFVSKEWWAVVGDQARRYVNDGVLRSDSDFNAFVTLTYIQNESQISTLVARDQKSAATNDRRMQFIKAVAAVALTLVFAAVAAPAFITYGFSAAKGAISVKEQIEGARGLAKIAKQYAMTDKAFSEQTMRVANMLDLQAALDSWAEGLTPEEEYALMQLPDGYLILFEGGRREFRDTPEAAMQAALEMSKPGERFKLYFNGQPVAFYIRTSVGAVEVPEDQWDKVGAMPPEQVEEIVERAEEEAAPEITAPAKAETPSWLAPAAVAAGILAAVLVAG